MPVPDIDITRVMAIWQEDHEESPFFPMELYYVPGDPAPDSLTVELEFCVSGGEPTEFKIELYNPSNDTVAAVWSFTGIAACYSQNTTLLDTFLGQNIDDYCHNPLNSAIHNCANSFVLRGYYLKTDPIVDLWTEIETVEGFVNVDWDVGDNDGGTVPQSAFGWSPNIYRRPTYNESNMPMPIGNETGNFVDVELRFAWWNYAGGFNDPAYNIGTFRKGVLGTWLRPGSGEDDGQFKVEIKRSNESTGADRAQGWDGAYWNGFEWIMIPYLSWTNLPGARHEKGYEENEIAWPSPGNCPPLINDPCDEEAEIEIFGQGQVGQLVASEQTGLSGLFGPPIGPIPAGTYYAGFRFYRVPGFLGQDFTLTATFELQEPDGTFFPDDKSDSVQFFQARKGF